MRKLPLQTIVALAIFVIMAVTAVMNVRADYGDVRWQKKCSGWVEMYKEHGRWYVTCFDGPDHATHEESVSRQTAYSAYPAPTTYAGPPPQPWPTYIVPTPTGIWGPPWVTTFPATPKPTYPPGSAPTSTPTNAPTKTPTP